MTQPSLRRTSSMETIDLTAMAPTAAILTGTATPVAETPSLLARMKSFAAWIGDHFKDMDPRDAVVNLVTDARGALSKSREAVKKLEVKQSEMAAVTVSPATVGYHEFQVEKVQLELELFNAREQFRKDIAKAVDSYHKNPVVSQEKFVEMVLKSLDAADQTAIQEALTAQFRTVQPTVSSLPSRVTPIAIPTAPAATVSPKEKPAAIGSTIANLALRVAGFFSNLAEIIFFSPKVRGIANAEIETVAFCEDAGHSLAKAMEAVMNAKPGTDSEQQAKQKFADEAYKIAGQMDAKIVGRTTTEGMVRIVEEFKKSFSPKETMYTKEDFINANAATVKDQLTHALFENRLENAKSALLKAENEEKAALAALFITSSKDDSSKDDKKVDRCIATCIATTEAVAQKLKAYNALNDEPREDTSRAFKTPPAHKETNIDTEVVTNELIKLARGKLEQVLEERYVKDLRKQFTEALTQLKIAKENLKTLQAKLNADTAGSLTLAEEILGEGAQRTIALAAPVEVAEMVVNEKIAKVIQLGSHPLLLSRMTSQEKASLELAILVGERLDARDRPFIESEEAQARREMQIAFNMGKFAVGASFEHAVQGGRVFDEHVLLADEHRGAMAQFARAEKEMIAARQQLQKLEQEAEDDALDALLEAELEALKVVMGTSPTDHLRQSRANDGMRLTPEEKLADIKLRLALLEEMTESLDRRKINESEGRDRISLVEAQLVDTLERRRQPAMPFHQVNEALVATEEEQNRLEIEASREKEQNQLTNWFNESRQKLASAHEQRRSMMLNQQLSSRQAAEIDALMMRPPETQPVAESTREEQRAAVQQELVRVQEELGRLKLTQLEGEAGAELTRVHQLLQQMSSSSKESAR